MNYAWRDKSVSEFKQLVEKNVCQRVMIGEWIYLFEKQTCAIVVSVDSHWRRPLLTYLPHEKDRENVETFYKYHHQSPNRTPQGAIVKAGIGLPVPVAHMIAEYAEEEPTILCLGQTVPFNCTFSTPYRRVPHVGDVVMFHRDFHVTEKYHGGKFRILDMNHRTGQWTLKRLQAVNRRNARHKIMVHHAMDKVMKNAMILYKFRV